MLNDVLSTLRTYGYIKDTPLEPLEPPCRGLVPYPIFDPLLRFLSDWYYTSALVLPAQASYAGVNNSRAPTKVNHENHNHFANRVGG